MTVSKPNIISRSQWGARSPKRSMGFIGNITHLTVHHTCDSNGITGSRAYAKVKNIQSYHQNNLGWSDIGYHFLISHDGLIFEGRKIQYQGAHVAAKNHNNVGISLIGTFNNVYISSAQERSLINLLAWLKQSYGVSISNIKGHRDFMSTDCPGHKVYNNLGSIRTKVANKCNGSSGSSSGTTYYRVMAGAFKNKSNAQDRQSQIKRIGYNSFLIYENNYYKVVAGSYTNRNSAQNTVNVLKRNNIDCYISTYKK